MFHPQGCSERAKRDLETAAEELQSANEELETMNAELQSTNDELNSLNDRLQERSEELNRTNGYFQSVLSGLNAAVAVLDRDLHVRRLWSGLVVRLYPAGRASPG